MADIARAAILAEDKTAGAGQTERDAGGVLRDRLWAVCGGRPPAGYAPPWDAIAGQRHAALTAALAAAGAHAPLLMDASFKGYTALLEDTRAACPAVYRALIGVRALVDLAPPHANKPSAAARPGAPGVELVYEARSAAYPARPRPAEGPAPDGALGALPVAAIRAAGEGP